MGCKGFPNNLPESTLQAITAAILCDFICDSVKLEPLSNVLIIFCPSYSKNGIDSFFTFVRLYSNKFLVKIVPVLIVFFAIAFFL